MGLHDFLMKHGLGAPGRMAKTQASIYKRARQAFPTATERQILAEMYRQRAQIGARTGLKDVYGMYEDPSWVNAVVETNPDLLSMVVYLILGEHREFFNPSAPEDAFSLLVSTVEEVLDRHAPEWRQRVQTGKPLVKLLLAANEGDTESQRTLGDIFYLGKGVRANRKEGRRWYECAAGGGDIEAQSALAELLDGLEEYPEAAKWYRAAAEHEVGGSDPISFLVAEARGALGDYFAEGKGVPRSSEDAAKWYRRAADLGNAGAQVCLAISYANGNGLSQDLVSAYQWFHIAALNGARTGLRYQAELVGMLDARQIDRAKPWPQNSLQQIRS